MNLLVGIFLAFIALFSGSPLIALILGTSLTLIFGSSEKLINRSTGALFLQAGIVIIGLTMSASNAINLTATYFPYISIFVILVFLAGILIGRILKIDTKLSILIASGTAVCGVTAIAAISPLIKAKQKDLLTSLAIIFVFNLIAIAIFPAIGSSIGMTEESFGAWIAMAIHDTSSVIGTALSYGGSTAETAATLKLGRTLWLIPLIIILGLLFKNDENQKTKLPLFVFVFILAVLLGTQLNLDQQTALVLDNLSRLFLIAALFCIGTQISPKSLKEVGPKIILSASALWVFAVITSFFLINWLH
tara:strand:+ start:2214 stop:3128 length:915 start_codon:yes stop_codon:yes gene_type:complete